MVDKVEQAYRRGADERPGGSSEESEDRKKIKTSDVVAHVDAVITLKKARAKAKTKKETDAARKAAGPKPAPEVALLLRGCRGTGGLGGLLEAVKDKGFRARVERAELQHERAELQRSVSEALVAASEGAFEGLRSERCALYLRAATLPVA